MKKFLSLLLCLTLICTTIVVPAMSVSADDTAPYADYVPGEKPGNLYVSDAGLTGRWLATFETIHPIHSGGIEGAMRYPIEAAPQYWGDSSTTPLAGGDMTLCIKEGYTWKANTRYFVETDLMNASAEGVGTVRFVYMIDAKDADGNRHRPYEVLEIEPGDEWQTFKFVLETDNDGEASSKLHYGYPNHSSLHNPQGTEIRHRIGSFYIAEETQYDMQISSDKTHMSEGDAGISFSVDSIVNQNEEEYMGESDIEWYVVNAERTELVSGFTITPSADGKSAVISAAKGAVPAGTYVAIAEDNLAPEGFRKGIEFTLSAYYSADVGAMTTRAKLNKTGEEWTNGSVSTGLAANILVEAELIGNTEAFTWFVLNSDRTALVDNCFDITVTAEGEKETAEVSVKADAPEGDYYVVAEAADGSLKGHPVTIDKSGDILVVTDTITSANVADIKAGLEGTYLPMLGLSSSVVVNSADKDALAAILASAAADEDIANATDVATLSEIVERLSVVSLYNTNPQGISLYDADGKFVYESELKIDSIDTSGVTLVNAFNTLTTVETKNLLQTNLTGKGYTSYSAFYEDAKEQMMLLALAYPNVNGVTYVADLFTAENLSALGIDTTKYLALTNKPAFNDTMANTLYTFADFKTKIESAQEVVIGGTTGGAVSGGSSSGGSSGGGSSSGGSSGGGFSVSSGSTAGASGGAAATMPALTTSFKDVPQTHWAYSDIHYLKSIGAISGVDAEHYAPESDVTREQFLKLIIDAFHIDKKASTKVFSDVDYSAWYAPYVSAGVENGIINGTSDATFGTGLAITRQDACTILAKALGLAGEAEGDLSFTDADSIAEYAKSSVSALAGYAIINGFEDGSFAPQAVCSRAQAARIIANAIGIVNAINADGR